MRRAITLLILSLATPGFAFAQAQSASRPALKLEPEHFGMTCAQILKMSSTDWIVYFDDKEHVATPEATSLERAFAVYGKCYDARTDALADSLARTGKGPTKAARSDFAAFEAALKDFAAKALADAGPVGYSQKSAYANLYEKQFRYLFYQDYEAKTVRPLKPAPPATKTAAPATPAPASLSADTRAAPTAATPQEQARSDADPVTMAKNHFGKLLEPLPDDKIHELHRAFGDVIGPYQISEASRLAVYRYAIFILEPPSAAPFSRPPF
jgi:hypothetical protein